MKIEKEKKQNIEKKGKTKEGIRLNLIKSKTETLQMENKDKVRKKITK